MSRRVSQITSLTIVYSTVYSGANQRKNQSSTSLAFVQGIHRWLVNSPHKGSVTRKMFTFGDVIVLRALAVTQLQRRCKVMLDYEHSRFKGNERSDVSSIFPCDLCVLFAKKRKTKHVFCQNILRCIKVSKPWNNGMRCMHFHNVIGYLWNCNSIATPYGDSD